MKKVVMILGLVCLTSPAFAKECKVLIEGDDVLFQMEEDSSLRDMTYREMFDLMHHSGKPDSEILKIVNAAHIRHETTDDKTQRSSIASLPKREKGDRRCKDKSITGYECRDKQLSNDFDAKKGIETPVQISIRKTKKDAIRELAHAFDCEVYKPKVASTKTSTKPSAAKAPEAQPANDGPAPADDSAPTNEPASDVETAAAQGSQVAQLAARPRGPKPAGVGPDENARPRAEVHPRAEDVVSTGVAPSARITVEASRTVR